jgi:hypothetical protein
MGNRSFTLAYGVVLMLGMAVPAEAEDNGHSSPQRVNKFSISICGSPSTRHRSPDEDLEVTTE